MTVFRAYLLNPAGRIMSALTIEAETPLEAWRRASETGHPHEIEIWQGEQCVHRGAAEEKQDRPGDGGG